MHNLAISQKLVELENWW